MSGSLHSCQQYPAAHPMYFKAKGVCIDGIYKIRTDSVL